MIEKLNEIQLREFLEVYLNAYPAISVSGLEQREKIIANWVKGQASDDNVKIYGNIRDGSVVGGMKLFDFIMNFHGKMIPVGGVGSVAVGLHHKKEKVCKELIDFFLKNSLEKGQKIAALYAFRPSFYKQMGFGYGPKTSKYRVDTLSLPKKGNKQNVVPMDKSQGDLLLRCYTKFTYDNHGMMEKVQREIDTIFNTEKNKVVGVMENEELTGYMIFEFVKGDNFLSNDIAVTELIYNNPSALQDLMTFLQSQGDQIQSIIFYSQDNNFHYLFNDPRDTKGGIYPYVTHETNKDGIGIMYRVLDCVEVIKELSHVKVWGEPITVKFQIVDTFLPDNNQEFTLSMDQSIKIVENHADVIIRMDISDFSSLIMGAVSFRALYNYGRVEITNINYLEKINNVFGQLKSPVCNTGF